jgi:hypothetical protein
LSLQQLVMKHDRFSHSYGNRAYGWRTIKKGGIIKWDGRTFQDDRIINLVGDRVEVFFEGKNTFADGPIKIVISYGGSLTIEKSLEEIQLEIRKP